MRNLRSLGIVSLLGLTLACGGKDEGGTSSEPESSIDETGGTTMAIAADATDTQTIAVGEESTLSGTNVSFPPGSLAISADIKVEEGTSLATAYVSNALGFTDEEALASAGPATVVTPSIDQDAPQPFQISIMTTPEAGSTLTAWALADELMILYKVRKAAENKMVLGILSGDQIEITAEGLSFPTSHFGVFQAVRAQPGTSAEEVVTEIPISTKANPPAIEFKKSTASVAEGGGPVSIAVSLTTAREDFVSVSYTLSGSASDADHGLVNGSFILEPNATTQTLSFHIVDDGKDEGDETLILTLSTAQNAKVGSKGIYTLTITDND